jgi:TetR/AcrR family tetracycline transcriptional repressor
MSTSRASVLRRPAETPPARPRAELSRDRIVAAALELIDARGLAALNMRQLGRVLGASTMGVYRHFANKAELLDAVIDDVVARFSPAPLDGPWHAQIRAISLRVRGAMLDHPELADLIGRQLRRSPTSLWVNIQIIDRLRTSGIPPLLLADTYWAMSSYTTGYVLLEAQTHRRRRASEARTSAPERVRKMAAMLRSVGEAPTEASDNAAVVLSRPLDEEQFLFGLECLIGGLEAKFAAAAGKTQAQA